MALESENGSSKDLDEATGLESSLMSINKFSRMGKDFFTINLFIRMEYCEGTAYGATLDK